MASIRKKTKDICIGGLENCNNLWCYINRDVPENGVLVFEKSVMCNHLNKKVLIHTYEIGK